uniref:Uncharacterized protein n=1 Tax=Anopheles atroparvus TaxID=41427 RepID=A0A182JKP1_ANOAO
MQEFECNATMLHEIVEKLPSTERLRWNDYRLDLACVTLADLDRWLKRLVRASSLSVTLDDPRGTAQNRRGQHRRATTPFDDEGSLRERLGKLRPASPPRMRAVAVSPVSSWGDGGGESLQGKGMKSPERRLSSPILSSR